MQAEEKAAELAAHGATGSSSGDGVTAINGGGGASSSASGGASLGKKGSTGSEWGRYYMCFIYWYCCMF